MVSEEITPGPENYRKIKKESTLGDPIWVFNGSVGEEERETECGRETYQEEGQVQVSCSQRGAHSSAQQRIKHQDTSHIEEKMPTIAVLMRGGERNTDRQRG